jgi:hypothetical protein
LNGQQLTIVLHFCALAIGSILIRCALKSGKSSSPRLFLRARKKLET